MSEEIAPSGAVYENETRPEKVVSLKDGQITVRTATFLKPTTKDTEEAAGVPNITPLLSEILPRHGQNWPSKVIFKGWIGPQKKWKEWIDRLAPKFRPIWIQAGIHDPILSSTFEIRCNRELVLGLSEYWCSGTNTFVFHWGEATITLEDMMILGGYSVYGGSVISPPRTSELTEIVENLRKFGTQISQCRANKVSQGEWIKFFMENDTDYEHAAFLSLWLSRFVFPSASNVVQKDIYPIAAKLSLGDRLALAPAVLASLYRDLRKLTEEAMASSENIALLAPFQLLQTWAFERFPKLVQKCPNLIQPGEPRMARWHKLKVKLRMPEVRSVFELAKNFQWRPYTANVKNWKHPSYYKEKDQLVSDYSCIKEDVGLLSFFKIVQATDLVGLNRREKYSPHRVSMQLGMDQDLPGELDELDLSREVVDFYIPPRTYQPGVTERYNIWWKDSLVIREDAMKHVLLKKKKLLNCRIRKDGDTVRRKHKAHKLPDAAKVRRKHKAHKLPDAANGPSQSKISSKASNESDDEDSNQPITQHTGEDSDDDHLPILTCLRKSFHHETSVVDSQTSNSSKRKLASSHEEDCSKQKVNSEELLSGKRTDEVLETLAKALDMNTDNQPVNGCARKDEEDETSNIKGNEEHMIALPDEFQIEGRVSRMEKIVARLKALKAARALQIRASSQRGLIHNNSKKL